MDKNEFLLLSEVLYQLHACQTMASLERNFFHWLNLFIPFRYASYIEISPQTQTHQVRFCHPQSFTTAERKWIALQDKDDTIWLSTAPALQAHQPGLLPLCPGTVRPPGGAEAAQPGPDPRPDPAGGGDPALFLPGDGQRRDLPRLEDLKKHFI